LTRAAATADIEARHVRADEAATQLPALLDDVAAHGAEVILDRGEQPAAVLIPFAAYEEIRAWRRTRRREAGAARLRALRAEVLARNPDITAEDADGIASRFIHEIVDEMAAEGRLRFERDGYAS